MCFLNYDPRNGRPRDWVAVLLHRARERVTEREAQQRRAERRDKRVWDHYGNGRTVAQTTGNQLPWVP